MILTSKRTSTFPSSHDWNDMKWRCEDILRGRGLGNKLIFIIIIINSSRKISSQNEGKPWVRILCYLIFFHMPQG